MTENKSQILIIEDSKEMAWSLTNLLGKAKFSIHTANSGYRGIEKFKELQNVDLIILNYILPDMSGLTVLRKLRLNGCSAEIIVISAFINQEVIRSFNEEGVFAILEKPFNINELIDVCRRAAAKDKKSRPLIKKKGGEFNGSRKINGIY